jgi:hypothetical protein
MEGEELTVLYLWAKQVQVRFHDIKMFALLI